MTVAQNPFEPALVVNEKVITHYEIDQRVRLLNAFGTSGNLRELAIEQLTDDRLRLQAGEAIGIEVTEETIDEGYAGFATSRGLTVDQVNGALTARGIAIATLKDFIRAGITWRDVVQARFRARARPTESDLDAALDFASKAVREEVLIQELALANAERGPEETLALAERLSRDLNRGGNFTAAVRRYSRAASAGRGGRLDWLPASNLPPTVAGQVLALLPGEVTAAITIPQGVTVIKLLDIREVPRDDTENQTLTLVYSQLVVPLASTAAEEAYQAAEAQLATIRDEAEFCTDLDARAEEFGISSGRSQPTPANAIPDEIKMTINALNVGEKAIQRDSRGVTLVMLCARSDESSPEERENLRERLFVQRLSSFGEGYLQELRGDALIIRK